MLLVLENQIVNLEISIGGVKETFKVVEGRIEELDLMRVQLRDYVVEAFNANWDVMKEALNASIDDQTEKLTKKNNALKAMVVALKEKTKAMMEKIKELEGELVVCRVAMGKMMLASVLK
ncbi:hypothetical protein PVK06_001560 [Gossypium arboreum]|uniref:Uncharacterized protein n=1 Tax=Gossypium arboreum TaxID=29729 RepID=A0ABR0R1G8_GOSAR|nr:hypothetical protein PVK06_001560 [Gossypium arboreum]